MPTCRSTRSWGGGGGGGGGNQGVKATDIPVVAFSVGEEELAGIDTKPLVGHLAAWNYFHVHRTRRPDTKDFIAKDWHAFTKDPKRVDQ